MGPLLDQLAKLVAVHEELRSAHQELLAERNGVRDELESTRTSLSRTSGELEAIRAALGTIASDVVSALSASAEPLGAELKALRAENQNLVSAFSECQRSITQIEEKVHEAAQMRTEQDALSVELRKREEELSDTRALSDVLESGLEEGRAAFAATGAGIAEIKQLLEETMANREHTMAVEFEKLNLQLEQARAALCSSERARAQEVEELRARLGSLGDQHAKLLEEYQSAESLLANVQARNAELTAEQAQLALRYQENLESEQLEREKIASELAGLRAGSQGSGETAGPSPSDLRAVQVAPGEAPDSTGARPDGPESRRDFASSDYLRRMMADAMKCGAVRGVPVGGRSESE